MLSSNADSVANHGSMNEPVSVVPVIEPGAQSIGSSAPPSLPGVCEEAFWPFLHENASTLMEIVTKTGAWS